jgi:hypothetical protein
MPRRYRRGLIGCVSHPLRLRPGERRGCLRRPLLLGEQGRRRGSRGISVASLGGCVFADRIQGDVVVLGPCAPYQALEERSCARRAAKDGVIELLRNYNAVGRRRRRIGRSRVINGLLRGSSLCGTGSRGFQPLHIRKPGRGRMRSYGSLCGTGSRVFQPLPIRKPVRGRMRSCDLRFLRGRKRRNRLPLRYLRRGGGKAIPQLLDPVFYPFPKTHSAFYVLASRNVLQATQERNYGCKNKSARTVAERLLLEHRSSGSLLERALSATCSRADFRTS